MNPLTPPPVPGKPMLVLPETTGHSKPPTVDALVEIRSSHHEELRAIAHGVLGRDCLRMESGQISEYSPVVNLTPLQIVVPHETKMTHAVPENRRGQHYTRKRVDVACPRERVWRLHCHYCVTSMLHQLWPLSDRYVETHGCIADTQGKLGQHGIFKDPGTSLTAHLIWSIIRISNSISWSTTALGHLKL
ncbi:uncharacterized protein CLUP02_14003 [Colletotrichum lupini]|uniref:Uncharacterized protein n=1 Tax=Colletotrichum lupini TaxID=145971 RepID=A0A9Q8WM68_9PEZI|nr:uncharacterized protein CLUP02_14003 [Colletotrichum lupini]UQC88479.1 hypothetical protein CLUP02_14003 [Colletotrichum lupini]